MSSTWQTSIQIAGLKGPRYIDAVQIAGLKGPRYIGVLISA